MTSFAHQTLTEFLAALAAPTPAPGGGAAAAVSGATAAALVGMVAGLSLKKNPDGADAALQERTAAQMATIRGELLTLADDDAIAYDAFIQAMRLPKGEDHEREARGRAMSAAAEHTAAVPLQTLRAISAVAEAARLLTGRSLASAECRWRVLRTRRHCHQILGFRSWLRSPLREQRDGFRRSDQKIPVLTDRATPICLTSESRDR